MVLKVLKRHIPPFEPMSKVPLRIVTHEFISLLATVTVKKANDLSHLAMVNYVGFLPTKLAMLTIYLPF